MNIVIVGQGAIGLLLYSQLSTTNNTYLVQKPGSEPLHTLTLANLDGTTKQININKADERDIINADCIIVCVKAFQVTEAIKLLFAICESIINIPIILCHNGLGTVELLKRYDIVPKVLLSMITTHGSLKASPSYVMHTGAGQSDVGLIQGKLNEEKKIPLLHALNNQYSSINWQENIQLLQWQKLLINCVINPLTAIYDVNNGDLALNQYNYKIQLIINEAVLVAQASNINLHNQTMLARVYDVINKTANNSSSMRQDIKLNRPTEIDFINGFIVEQAKKLNIATPENEVLLAQVKQLSAKH